MTSPWRSMSSRERLHFVTGHWRYAVPAIASVIAIGLMAVPIFTPAPSVPHLALLVVYVWAAFQPTMMPPWLAFMLGLLADLWLALPLGTNATLLPLLALIAGFVERRFGHRPFLFDWLLVIPAIYALVDGLKARVSRRLRPAEAARSATPIGEAAPGA